MEIAVGAVVAYVVIKFWKFVIRLLMLSAITLLIYLQFLT